MKRTSRLRQVEANTSSFTVTPPMTATRFVKIHLRVARRMRQRNEHLPRVPNAPASTVILTTV